MDEADFDGIRVLEKLSKVGALDAYYQAVASDDATQAEVLLQKAGVAPDVIHVVLKKMAQVDLQS